MAAILFNKYNKLYDIIILLSISINYIYNHIYIASMPIVYIVNGVVSNQIGGSFHLVHKNGL